MDALLHYKGLAILIAFAIFFTIEHWRPAVSNVLDPAKRIIKNMFFWPINIGLSFLIILPLSYVFTQMQFWARPEWMGGITGFVFDVLVLDLFMYWWHRIVHEVQFFWKFHEVHHMDEHLDTTSAVRFHFGEIFFSVFARAPVIILLSIPYSSIVLFETLVFIFVLFHHSNIRVPAIIDKLLSKLIVTPSLHWVHHHAIRKDTDSNYGTIFSFWDRLFQSKSNTKRFDSMPIGVEGLKDKNFKKLIFRPFQSIFKPHR